MKSFDIAVQSRIRKSQYYVVHISASLTYKDIAIKYDELDSDQQFAIFESFLDQLRRKKLVEDYEDLISWAKKDGKKLALNGRQIRNIVSTAMNIALVDNKSGMGKLKREHLSRVAKQTKDFKQELRTQEDIYRAKTK
jgi:FMN phosphatase YigB (HAD superfamily)